MADAEPRAPTVHTWITYAIIAANVAMFGVELAMGVHATNPTPQQMIEVGASYPPLTTDGEWWRLVASMFLHFGLLHIALNMVCLWQGRVVETLFGRGAFAAIYVLAGLAGGVASLVRNPHAVTAGASGAVFGIYGAFGAFLVLRKHTMPAAVWQATARGIGMFVVINLIFGMVVPSISLTAHVGGLVFGFLVGAALLWKSEAHPNLARIVAVAVAGLALVVGALFVIPKPSSRGVSLADFAHVEMQALQKWRDLEQRHRTGKLDDAAAVLELERDVLVPWRSACTELTAIEPAERFRPLLASLADYCAARWASWETFASALRATGDEKRALVERHRFQEVELRKSANRVLVEQQALDPANQPK